MDTIRLDNVCPDIFQDTDVGKSEIWNKQVSFEKGKTYLVEAMSGTGKSSLCSFLCGYRNDYQGTVYFDDTPASSLGIGGWTQVRSLHISHMIQDLKLFPELTAMENVLIKNQLTRHKTEAEIQNWFHLLGIGGKTGTLAGKMSFGQQQRVALIRALCQPFDFILADEPVSHLDDENARQLCHLLFSEAKACHAGVIVTSIGKHVALPYDHVFHL